MGIFITEIFIMTREMEWEYWKPPGVTVTKGSGRIIKFTGKVISQERMGSTTTGIGIRTISTGMEFLCRVTGTYMRGTGWTTREMG